jgi:hypothetical protein
LNGGIVQNPERTVFEPKSIEKGKDSGATMVVDSQAAHCYTKQI